MNFLKKFFSALFGHVGDIVHVILHDSSSLINLALPIVTDLSKLAHDDSSVMLQSIAGWLDTFVKDAGTVSGWVNQQDGKSTGSILQSAAQLALGALVPTGTTKSIINFAIEAAYQIFLRQKPA